MQRAADFMLGDHDFRNFCKMDVEHVLSFRRNILAFRVEAAPAGGMAGRDVALLHIRGTAFLWHQVWFQGFRSIPRCSLPFVLRHTHMMLTRFHYRAGCTIAAPPYFCTRCTVGAALLHMV